MKNNVSDHPTDHAAESARWIDRRIIAESVFLLFGAVFVGVVAGLQQKFVIGVENLEIKLLIAPIVVGGALGSLVGYFVRRSRRPLLENLEQERTLSRSRESTQRLLEDQVSASATSLEAALEQMTAAQEDLRQRNLILETQLNASLDGILVVDKSDRAVSWNQRFMEMWKIPEELLTKGDLAPIMKISKEMVNDSDELERLIMEFRKNVGDPEELPGREVVMKDGRVLEIFSRTLSDQEGHANGRISFNRDVTEQKKIEKLKSEFISLASHELRTPLTSIFASIRLLLSDEVAAKLDDQAKGLLEISSRNCNRLLSLVDDILDMEKIITGKMTFDFAPVDIGDVVRKSIEENEAYAHEFDVKLEFEKPDGPISVSCDSERIIQVMSNLLSNAAKFSPRGEVVTVDIEFFDDIVRVSVADLGDGVPAGFDKQIFEKFTQAENLNTRSKGGLGLGLSISKSIIDQHGGTIDFKSEKGKGATFYFELPRI